MKKTILYSILFSVLSLTSMAQTSADALRFSQTFNGGTARFVGLGGAFGALGGDFTSLSYNPAGLGVYRSSEFTITPSFKSRSISSTYNGSSSDDARNRLYFDNVGFIFSFKPNKESETGFVNFNLAFGYNRTNDFFSNSISKGNNDLNSIMDMFACDATENGYLNNNLTEMAWNTYLIDTISGTGGNEYQPLLGIGDGVTQQKASSTKGTSGEYVLSFATNFSNKLFLGLTLGIQNFHYTQSDTYEEFAYESNPVLSNGYRFYSLSYNNTLETNGTGYNVKLGAIYKPIEGLRLGIALHSPTFFSFEDTYSSSMFSDLDSMKIQKTYLSKTKNNRYEYDFETPFKAIASAAYIFKDFGLISFDYEHINYSSMRFRDGGDGYNYTSENQDISNIYRNANNIRIGGEFKIKDIYLRAGYALYSNPFKKGISFENNKRTIISGGIGYRSGNFFADAAYMYSIQKEGYAFYQYVTNSNDLITTNPISTKMTEGKFLVTIGFKF